MSQQDVELVRALNLAPGVDWAAVLRDDARFAPLLEAVQPHFDPAFECAMVAVTETRLAGLTGLRQIWLDWLEPWASYRTEEQELTDLGDGRVLYLGRDFAGRRDGRGEVELHASAIWTLRAGRVREIVFYTSREAALQVAGVESGEANRRTAAAPEQT